MVLKFKNMNKIEFYKVGKKITDQIMDEIPPEIDEIPPESIAKGRVLDIIDKHFKIGARHAFGKE